MEHRVYTEDAEDHRGDIEEQDVLESRARGRAQRVFFVVDKNRYTQDGVYKRMMYLWLG